MIPLYFFDPARRMLFFLTLMLPAMLPDQQGLTAQTISGNVFEDYNANGSRDVGEPGIGGIIVNGYEDGDAAGSPTHTATTNLDGTYSISTGGNNLRLEFEIPTPLAYLRQGAAGSTSVLFANNGATGVDASFNNPANYSIEDPLLVTPCYVVLDHDDPTGGKRPVLAGNRYSWGTIPTVADVEDRIPISAIYYAQNEEIGTTYGVAWNRNNNTLYLSTYHKKHTDYGPTQNPGSIYQIQIDPVTGLPISAPSEFVDVDDFSGISVCGSHGDDLNALPDAATADLVGKCALGDLDISDDNTKLYTVNLNDRKIVEIDIATGTMTNNWQFPTTLSGTDCFSCNNSDDVRPFGLKYRNGLLYVGGMCTGENTQNNDDVVSFIYSLDPSQGGAATFNEFFCFDWGGTFDNGDDRYWMSGAMQEANLDRRNYMFSDIEFYGNDLIMAFRDRSGDMLGDDIPGVPDGDGRGEIVTAWFNTATGTYEIEAVNGSNVSAGPNRPGSPTNYGETPGGAEFYWGDGGYFHNNNPFGETPGAPHEDQSFGGLAQINTQDIVMTSLTPRQPLGVGQTSSGGFAWLNNATGAPTKSYTLYRGGGDEPGSLLRKANGLGDVEGLTTPAPIEIGDYVWVDDDQDGVQDPGEPPLSGVEVELYKNGNLVAVTTTDANGRYYFTSEENPVTSGAFIDDAPINAGTTLVDAANELNNGNLDDGFRINRPFYSYGGLRFQNLDIPPGATITNAYIQFTSNDSAPESDDASVIFFAEDVDDSPAFDTGNSDDISNRTLSTANVRWDIPAFGIENVATLNERSPDLTSLVQEVIDRGGWNSGNDLSIIIELGVDGNDGTRRVGSDPRLVVEWTSATAVSGTNTGDILSNMAYEVRLALNQSEITTPGYSLTGTNTADSGSDSSNDEGTDIRDNDANENSGNAVIAFNTGAWGENNHGLDFGFSAASAMCMLNPPTITTFCDDNGTPADPSDDVFFFTINVTGTNTGASYSLTIGGDVETGLSYGVDEGNPFGPFPISGGDLTATVTDVDDPTCQLVDVTITAPATCSPVVPPSICPCPDQQVDVCWDWGSTFVNPNGSTTFPYVQNFNDYLGSGIDVTVTMSAAGDDFDNVNCGDCSFGFLSQYNCGDPDILRYYKDGRNQIDQVIISFSEPIVIDEYIMGGVRDFGNEGVHEITMYDGPNGTGNFVTPNPAIYPNPAAQATINTGDALPGTAPIVILGDQGTQIMGYDATRGAYIQLAANDEDQRPWTILDYGGVLVQSIVWETYSATDGTTDPLTARNNLDNSEFLSAYIGSFSMDVCGSCSSCSLNAPTIVATCNDNGTPADPSDDTFEYTIEVMGTNTGATYSISGDDMQSGLSYGVVEGPFGPFPISGGDLTITITDVDDGTCQLVDQTVTAPATCSSSNDDCDCKDYVYLNEVGVGSNPANGAIHKYEVGTTDGVLQELFGGSNPANMNPWYPGDGTSELPNPHGLGVDLNGYLYISETFAGSGDIRRFNCDGEITPNTTQDPVNGFQIDNPVGGIFNIQSFEGVLYSNGGGSGVSRIYRFDACTGLETGFVTLQASSDTEYDGDPETDWGFYINEETGTFYATTTAGQVFRFNPTDADFTNNTVFPPFITPAATPADYGIGLSATPLVTAIAGHPSPGSLVPDMLHGITTDDEGNIFVVRGDRSRAGTNSQILKYNTNGILVEEGPLDTDDSNGGWNRMIGITYSSASDRLYTSTLAPNEDCVYSWNANDLTDHRSEVPPTGNPNAVGKGINILTECCPTSDLVLEETVCGTAGEKIFLQDVLNCGTGVVCEGQWSVETANVNQVFNECDLSITVNGSGCATYVLEKTSNATGAQRCDAFRIELQVCTEVPEATVSVIPATCDGDTPNDDASLVLESVTLGDAYAFVASDDFEAGGGDTDYANATSINVANLPIDIATGLSNPSGSQDYTVRIFDGASDCFSDVTVTLNETTCASFAYDFDCETDRQINVDVVGITDDSEYCIDIVNDLGLAAADIIEVQMLVFVEQSMQPTSIEFSNNGGTIATMTSPSNITAGGSYYLQTVTGDVTSTEYCIQTNSGFTATDAASYQLILISQGAGTLNPGGYSASFIGDYVYSGQFSPNMEDCSNFSLPVAEGNLANKDVDYTLTFEDVEASSTPRIEVNVYDADPSGGGLTPIDNFTFDVNATPPTGAVLQTDGEVLRLDRTIAGVAQNITELFFEVCSPVSAGESFVITSAFVDVSDACTEQVAIGNYVFMDNNENDVFDGGDMGIGGVVVQLYASNVTPDGTSFLASTATDVNGYYYFDDLAPGEYVVYIPSSEFAMGEPLFNKLTIPGAGGDDQTDNDDNGLDAPVNGGIASGVIDLQPNAEPTGEEQGNYPGDLDDDNVNATVDFGFRRDCPTGNCFGVRVEISDR